MKEETMTLNLKRILQERQESKRQQWLLELKAQNQEITYDLMSDASYVTSLNLV